MSVKPTTVIHIKDKLPGDVYIGRGSKWGNPFKIDVHGTREQVINLYKVYLANNKSLMNDIPELKGKRLVCYCAPKACHGDVLAQLANEVVSTIKI